jgi:hypothetical protein
LNKQVRTHLSHKLQNSSKTSSRISRPHIGRIFLDLNLNSFEKCHKEAYRYSKEFNANPENVFTNNKKGIKIQPIKANTFILGWSILTGF